MLILLCKNRYRLNSFLDHYYSVERQRFMTREILIGGLALGGNNPIRVQSMTNTDTNDTDATVAQCIRLADAGCELIRITAQGEREAKNLAQIKKELANKGYNIPLIADIHFNPRAAEVAASIVEKVRINPGNYTDRNTPGKDSFTVKEYELELERIAERIDPLLTICKRQGTAIRIGSNHGSLSSRIMSRYGDTPEGMVESALEFARICRDAGFFNLVLSMKSSNVRVMVQATRLLAHRMMQEGLDFPLHLGVTEAGDGDDGIIKSAAGIGALLEDGIGDTIRVSLTGDPVKEIPVALAIAGRYNEGSIGAGSLRKDRETKASADLIEMTRPRVDPFSFRKRESEGTGSIGGNRPVQVLTGTEETLSILDENGGVCGMPGRDEAEKLLPCAGNAREMRKKALSAVAGNDKRPLLLTNTYSNSDILTFMVDAAIDFGTVLTDGFGDAIRIDATGIAPEVVNRTAFSILQATRSRITRTEFISCPSCGRTLFDIEATLAKVKAATSHLKGLKIAVMGCIVNGPGEMADADFGYVGAGKGRITLYKGKEVVSRNIPEEEAIPALLALIKESGRWKEPAG